MAGCASAQLICVGLAPSAVKVSRNRGEPTTRIFMPLRSAGVLMAASALCPMPPAWAQTDDDKFSAFRDMLAEDNPGEFWIDAGKALFHEPREPKKQSLETCDLGLGPGVLKGAYAQMPRHFADTGRVETLEGRLLTCMDRLQRELRQVLLIGLPGSGEEGVLRPGPLRRRPWRKALRPQEWVGKSRAESLRTDDGGNKKGLALVELTL